MGLPVTVVRADADKSLLLMEEDDDEQWMPGEEHRGGEWRSGRVASRWQRQPALQAQRGVTALAGHVLRLNGQPLPDVTLRVGAVSARTDDTGRFLLESVPSGQQVLVLDGRTASRPGRAFGTFETGVQIRVGETNVLPYTIWMSKLDTAHAVRIPSPTTSEVILTNPLLGGLEVHIPPGTVIRDRDGEVVTEVSITPLPLDRVPFPGPANVQFPVLFTMQPGTSRVEGPGLRIVFPNYADWPAGKRTAFWRPDPVRGWHVYGRGTVSADGQQVVPDPGVVLDRLMCSSIGDEASAPADWPAPGDGQRGGDPVDLGTGLFVVEKTDVALPDILPISLTRTYRPGDATSRAFGIGALHGYDIYVVGDKVAYSYADLVLPDGGRVHYNRTSPGTLHTDAVMEHTATPTGFYKSTLYWNGARGSWDIKLKDGTTYEFHLDFNAELVVLRAIVDRLGNRLNIARSAGKAVTNISSPSGRWVEFAYGPGIRVSQVTDNSGRVVSYTYDLSGRLTTVTDSAGSVTTYTYDASHRMLTIRDARNITFLTNQYDANGRVTQQTQADGTTYLFAYTLDGNGRVTQADVTDPRGTVRRVTFSASRYSLTDTAAPGQPEQQTTTYERQTGTNFVTAVIDPLNRRTTYTYDALGNITAVTGLAGTADAFTTSLTYQPTFNQVATATDPLGHTTTLGYDGLGNLTSVTDPLGHQTTLAYNGPVSRPLLRMPSTTSRSRRTRLVTPSRSPTHWGGWVSGGQTRAAGPFAQLARWARLPCGSTTR